MNWFETHRERLELAVQSCATRGAWTPFVESPSRRHHPEGARERGLAEFESYLGARFPLEGVTGSSRVGGEISPYTGLPLGIDYPAIDDIDAHIDAASAGLDAWAEAAVQTRVGVCMEMLDRLAQNVFANTYATMHTAGQAYMMAFAGSGANSLDRGLEALAYAYRAMIDVPEEANFERRFGGEVVRLRKTYRLRPRGVALVITCASYPAWNAYPAIMANLATGNPVVVKPHPGGTLPMAMTVRLGRQVLQEAGFDPNLLTLAPDTLEAPITKALALHPRTAIVDFTGSAAFGAWLEDNCRRALVYTETSGCNAVIVESTRNLRGLLDALAQGICLFSSQMCTSPQNIFVPQTGIQTDEGLISAETFADRLVAAIDELVADPAHAAATCGALQSTRVSETIALARRRAEVLREPQPYAHPEHTEARTATPLLLREHQPHEVSRREWFGPVAFVLPVADRDAALELAARDIRELGSIAAYLYTTDEGYLAEVETAFSRAGGSFACNLFGHRPINFTAAYSDYHVSGLNPAGNASLTDLAFVANRFRIVQSKVEL